MRRELKNDADIDAIAEFLNQLGRTVRYVVAFLLGETLVDLKDFKVRQGDARDLSTALSDVEVSPDVVVTSPPYATALPYLDTDRLSLCYLKLLPRQEHRATDYQMIGNREISETQRLGLWDLYLSRAETLPKEIRNLITEVDQAYGNTDVGFRRRNLPALLAKYFLDMQKVLTSINLIVNHGGHVFIVVGDNHTIAHERRIDIQTAKLIDILGESVGMQLVESIPMDMLTPRDIFKRNAVASEHIVHLQVCH
jgi:site-specific DNA-methyltransferase (cytosine-N4-specific)